MALAVNTNLSSLMAKNSLRVQNLQMSSASMRLATGIRINSAKDDAAGLAISSRMNIKIHSLEVAIRNASNGISLLQTAEGGLASISENLQRIRELAVQSSNSTYQQADHKFLNGEANELISEIDRIADNTTFNGIKLLDGSFKDKTFQIGANNTANDSLTVSIPSAHINQNVSKLRALNSVETKTITEDVTRTTYSAQTSGSVVSSSALNSGDLSINGISIGASSSGSAKDIAAAINQKTSLTGVTATARENTAQSISLNVSPSTQAAAEIDLGTYGKLIYPAQVDGGKLYYYWDRNGNGGWQAEVWDADIVSHHTLNGIFNQDINGNISAGGITTDVYRYATINGYKLALPTVGEAPAIIGFRPGTTISGDSLNPTYDDYLALWDANNGTANSTVIQGAPTNWPPNGHFWTATPSGSSHAYVVMQDGHVVDGSQYSDSALRFVALQVLNSTAVTNQISDDAIRINGVNIGAIAIANTSSERATQMLNAINAKTSSTGVVASIDSATGGINLTAADGRNIVISTLTSSAITGDQIGIALNGVTSGSRSVTTYSSGIDLTSTSSSGITIVANANGANASGFTTGATSPTSTITTETVISQVQVPSTKTEAQNSPEKLFFINLSTAESSQASLTSIDLAIDAINQSRATLGGYQSRFSSAMDVTESEITNLASSKSRIVDADYAMETTNLAKSQIISHAATSMLAQANIPNQLVQVLLKDF